MLRILTLIASIGLVACSDAPKTASSDTPTVSEPGAYMIVMGKDYEAADLGPYAASLPPIYKKYGGRYVALSTDYRMVEGELDTKALIISAWPNADAAQTFWDSPEYSESIKLRDGIGEFTVAIVPALPAQR